tara:strand:- start:89 stop:673 length:585 start_codon:yes stop_codon:yes gene_type:complete
MNKWIGISLGTILGVSHIGMIGLLATRNTSKLPTLNIPVGDYTTYNAEVTEGGYKIAYKGNDPKIMTTVEEVKKKGGFLGFADDTTSRVVEYTMDGAAHHGGPVSTRTSWIDPSAQRMGSGGIPSDKTVACIEAVGGGKQTGRLVGTSIGAAAAPSVSGIPFVGWLAAGWVAMFGGNQGAEIGGNMVQDLNKNC